MDDITMDAANNLWINGRRETLREESERESGRVLEQTLTRAEAAEAEREQMRAALAPLKDAARAYLVYLADTDKPIAMSSSS